MANKRYGLKEVANVIFFDVSTGKPQLFFDTLKVSTIENESESAEATGGQGGARLMSWDYGRRATLTMQDALLSDVSLAMLSGNAVQDGSAGITVVGRETLTVAGDATNGYTITLAEATAENINVMLVKNGVIDPAVEVTVGANLGGEVDITAGAVAGDTVMAFYEYQLMDENASKITFSASAFPATYRVVGDTLGKDQYGQLRKMQFVIPQAKLQSAFSLTMDVENVSVFDFNLDVLVDPTTNKLYDIITM
jgi:hypothetical protein